MTAAARTPAQNRRLYGLRRDLALAGLEPADVDGLVRQLAMEISGQEHTSRLSAGQAAVVIDGLEARLKAAGPRRPQTQAAPHEPWAPRQDGRRDELAVSARQIEVIGYLCEDAGLTTLPQRAGFFARQLGGRRRIETQKDADAIIEPLKAMILRRQDLGQIVARLATISAHPKLREDVWLVGFVADVQERVGRQGVRAVTPGRLAKLVEAEMRCGLRGGR